MSDGLQDLQELLFATNYLITRSNNEDKCKDCPRTKLKTGEKIEKKNKNKEEKRRNRNKGNKNNRKGSKKNKRNRNKKTEEEKKKENIDTQPTVEKASRYAPSTKLNEPETEDEKDLGPFGNFFKSLVIRNTFA